MRSMQAFWMGGAGAAPPSIPSGRRSMLAFWMGGASARSITAEIVEEPRQFFANFDRSLMAEVDRKLRRRKEEEELVIILAVAVTKRLLH